jgi:hypothetical protein
MTTKKFFSLSDILGVLIECQNPKCKASISLGGDILKELAKKENNLIAQCPACGSPWMDPPIVRGQEFDSDLKKFLRALEDIQELPPKGCSLKFEIKHEDNAQDNTN